MNTNSRTLPIRDCLDMGVVVVGLRVARAPRPVYQLVFRLRMCNKGQRSVRLLGRKWTLRERGGKTRIIEAAHVFNQQPVLTPGAVFSSSGCQAFDMPPTAAEVCFFGTDSRNQAFITPSLVFPRHCFSLPWQQ